jgi:hypothetical protein
MAEYLLEWRRFATFQNEDTPVLWAYAISASILLFVIHYAIMQVSFSQAAKEDDKLKIPPLIPYSIPLLGNVPCKYFWDPIQFFCTSK